MMGLRTSIQKFLRPTIASTGLVSRNINQTEFTPQEQLTGVTYKAVHFIAQAVSQYQPTAKRNDKAFNHPIKQVINNPNSLQPTSSEFHNMFAMLNEIYGETFWYKIRTENSRRIRHVQFLNPTQVQLVVDDDGDVVGYILHKSNGDRVPFDYDEILHDKSANPFNEYRGQSILEKSSTYIATERTSADFTMNYLANAASPSGILQLPQMSKDAFDQFTRVWREQYEGPKNAGKTGFLKGGEAKFTAVGSTLKDIDQKVTRDMARDDVLMMFGVPKGLLGVSNQSGMGRNELEPLEYIFAKYKVEPIMQRLDNIWSQLSAETQGGRTDISHESVIPDDKQFELERQKSAVNQWLTIDEVRAMQGLEPLPNGAGAVLVDKNPQVAIQNSAQRTAKKVTLKTKPTKAQLKKAIKEEQEQFRSKLVDTNDTYERELKRAIADFANKQRDAVVSKIDSSNKSFEEWLFAIKDQSEEMQKLMLPIILELMEEQSAGVANFITGNPMEVTDELQRVVKTRILEIAGIYNKDTYQALEKTIAEAVGNGEGLVKVRKRVEDVYSSAAGYRAERIARTESLKASNLTAEEVYKQNGYNRVEWFTNPGACKFCATFEGNTKEIGGKFLNQGQTVESADGDIMQITYSDIPTPPLHPNCTCSLIPVV